MAKILYGVPVREHIKVELKKRVHKLGRSPVLAIVQVGERDDSNIYIKNKIKFGEEIGVSILYKKCPENIKEAELIDEIEKVNKNAGVDGIIVQLPLPENLNKEKIIQSIDPKKDVDGLSSVSDFSTNTLVTPATARGVLALLDFYKIEFDGKKVAVIGRSNLTGGPIAETLRKRGGEIFVCHKGTENIVSICKNSDIIISATGKAGLVTGEFVKNRQIVVDVGINRINGKLVGDVLFEEVEKIVTMITPVPGGVGPLTVACLFENLLDLIKNRMSEKFKKTLENFVCENCGEGVDGDGYTNHCPHCLCSKHVDNFPGDRAAVCGGLMTPIDTEESGGKWCVIQKCDQCGKIHKNKLSVKDNFDHLVAITKDKK